MNLIGQDLKKITLNLIQLAIAIAPQRFRMVRAGRGSGKSVSLAIDITAINSDMPRSKNFLLNESFQFALTNTLPSTLTGLDFLGYKRDLHYFFGRTPPKSWNWPTAYEPPLNPSRTFYFANGTVWDLLSQEASSRGPNYSAGLGDEALLLNADKIRKETIATLRGQYHRFKDKQTFGRLGFYTSTPRTRSGEWIYQWEELAREDPSKYLFIEAPSMINSYNLPPDYFSEQKRLMSPQEYEIEILNIRPKGILGGFYPFFDERRHSYNAYNDSFLEKLIGENYLAENFKNLDCKQDLSPESQHPDISLEIAADYGSWFNGIVTGQERKDINRFRVLSAMSHNETKLFEDVVSDWCNYYRSHPTKHVYYYYDHTAIGTDGRTLERYYDIMIRVLKGHGWEVTDVYIGKVPDYSERYEFFGRAHRGMEQDVPLVEYHKHNCKWLIVSIQNAGVRQGKNGFEKDKRDEQYHEIDQRTTTHFSDAHDTLIFGKYKRAVARSIGMASPRTGSRK